MRALQLSDLAIVLPHLLDEKADALAATLSGQHYRPHLEAQLSALERRPRVRTSGRPLTETLEDAELVIETVGLLTELREAIASELADDAEAHLEADTALFSLIDELAADRQASVRRRTMATTLVLPGSLVGSSPSAE
jgi:hypothetical protein